MIELNKLVIIQTIGLLYSDCSDSEIELNTIIDLDIDSDMNISFE